MPCIPRRQQANSITGNRQRARDAEMSDITSKSLLPMYPMYPPLGYPPLTYPPLSYPQQNYPQLVYPQQQPLYRAAPQPSYPPQSLPPAQYGPPKLQYGPPDLVTAIAGGGIAGIKSKFTIFTHAHCVDCKLTTSQETYNRPDMRRCPTPPPKSCVQGARSLLNCGSSPQMLISEGERIRPGNSKAQPVIHFVFQRHSATRSCL